MNNITPKISPSPAVPTSKDAPDDIMFPPTDIFGLFSSNDEDVSSLDVPNMNDSSFQPIVTTKSSSTLSTTTSMNKSGSTVDIPNMAEFPTPSSATSNGGAANGGINGSPSFDEVYKARIVSRRKSHTKMYEQFAQNDGSDRRVTDDVVNRPKITQESLRQFQIKRSMEDDEDEEEAKEGGLEYENDKEYIISQGSGSGNSGDAFGSLYSACFTSHSGSKGWLMAMNISMAIMLLGTLAVGVTVVTARHTFVPPPPLSDDDDIITNSASLSSANHPSRREPPPIPPHLRYTCSPGNIASSNKARVSCETSCKPALCCLDHDEEDGSEDETEHGGCNVNYCDDYLPLCRSVWGNNANYTISTHDHHIQQHDDDDDDDLINKDDDVYDNAYNDDGPITDPPTPPPISIKPTTASYTSSTIVPSPLDVLCFSDSHKACIKACRTASCCWATNLSDNCRLNQPLCEAYEFCPTDIPPPGTEEDEDEDDDEPNVVTMTNDNNEDVTVSDAIPLPPQNLVTICKTFGPEDDECRKECYIARCCFDEQPDNCFLAFRDRCELYSVCAKVKNPLPPDENDRDEDVSDESEDEEEDEDVVDETIELESKTIRPPLEHLCNPQTIQIDPKARKMCQKACQPGLCCFHNDDVQDDADTIDDNATSLRQTKTRTVSRNCYKRNKAKCQEYDACKVLPGF